MEVSDEALLRQFIAGDVSAFGPLVARHRNRTYAICWRILRNVTGRASCRVLANVGVSI